MGKNSKTRRRDDRDEIKSAVTGVGDDRDADESEQLKAIRIERKLAAAAILRQLLGTSHQELLGNEDGYDDFVSYGIDSEQLNDVSDTVASDWLLSGRRMPPDGSDSSGGEEGWSPDDDSNLHQTRSQSQDEHLPSRKLVLRQMVMNQLNVMQRQQQRQSASSSKASAVVGGGRTGEGRMVAGADQELDEAASEADSWLEMEERFAEIYEPIPFDVGMDSWRSMTKQQMLRTVNSRRLRSSMQHMSRSQILAQIRTIKVQRNGHASTSTNGHQANGSNKNEPAKINHKNPVYEDMSGSLAPKPPLAAEQQQKHQQQQHRHKSDRKAKTSKKVAHKQRADSHLYQNTAAYDGETLADIYEAKVEAHRQLLRLQQQQQQQSSDNGLYVTRAMVHAAPYDSDGVDGSGGQNRKHFVSRSDIVSKWSGGASVKPGVTTTSDEQPHRLGHLVVQKSRSQMMEELRRQSDYITTVYSVGGALGGPLIKTMGNGNSNGKEKKDCDAKSCTSSCPSDCDGGVCDDDNCSLCSCSSCGTFNGTEEESDQDICNGQEQQQQRHRTEVAEQNRSRLISTIDAAAPVPSLKDDTRRTKNKKKKEKNKKATTSASPIEGDEIDEWRKKSSKKRNESGASTPEPVPLNLVKQRRMEFERLRILDEQETRLKELVRRQQQQHHNDVCLDENQMQTWSTLARRARLLEERWNQAQQRGHGDADDEVDGSDEEEEQQSERLLGDTGSVSGGVNKRKQRTKLIQQLKNRMRQNMAAVSLDPRVRQRRHEKLKQLLNDALHAGTQTLSNINLGLIYVPPLIDDSTSNSNSNSPPSSEKGPNQGKKEKAAKEKKQKKPKKESKLSSEKKGDEVLQENGDEEEDDEDVFGSIDTLIFEPKNSSLERPSSSAATVNEDDLTDVERKIAQQFDYLYDSQYGGAQSDMDTEQPRRPKSAVAAGEEDSNSKNVRQAAAAGVVAAAAAASSTQVNLPLLTANSFATKTPLLHQQQQAAVGTAMAIVAASAEAKKAATVTAAVATTTTISPRSYAAAAYYDVSASCKMAPGQIPPPPPLPNSNQAPAIASTPASNNPSTDSDSDSDTTSNISFGSVIYQGQKLLDLAQKQQQTQRETGLVSQQPAGEKEGRSQLTLRRQPPLHPPPPPPPPQSAPESRNGTVSINGSVCFDSEQYTNADTDASWDYYPDGDALSDGDQDDQGLTQSANRPDEGKPVGPTLTVGNLRKRPTTDQSSGNMLGQHVYGHDAEADETARLLESLRMAEDSHMSTSLRLIFPPDGSKHRLVPSFQLDIAPDTVNYQHLMANRAAAEPTTLIDEFGSPVTHFRSLPELSQVVNFASVNQSDAKTQAALVPPSVRTAFQPHIGIRKRDTMIRELKLKLKLRDRQQQQQQQKTRGNDSSGPADSILKKPKTALDKLESILSSFSSLAEMKADGHIYRTANELRLQQQQQQQQPLSLPEYSTTASRVAAESAVGNEITEYDIPAILSTGYPHHLLYHILANNNNQQQQQQQQLQSMESMSDEPTTIYDPSLPGDLADFESLVQIQNQRARHGGAEVAYSSNRNKEMNPYYHEGLYSISEPLTERQNVRSPTARRNRRRRKRGHGKSNRAGRTLSSEQQDDGGCDSGAESTWSDMENRIFAMNGIGGDFDLGPLPHPLFAAADQMLPPPPPPVPHHHQQQQPPHVINNRMAPYHGDEWLFWDQLHQWRRTMVDQQRWEEEKARRMLLWVHHSQDPIAALASLGQLAAVGNGVAGGYPTATSLPHLPHWWQVD